MWENECIKCCVEKVLSKQSNKEKTKVREPWLTHKEKNKHALARVPNENDTL